LTRWSLGGAAAFIARASFDHAARGARSQPPTVASGARFTVAAGRARLAPFAAGRPASLGVTTIPRLVSMSNSNHDARVKASDLGRPS